jgi:transcriptional regulator with XRE-family HTH domain
MGISQSELARRLGVSRQAVQARVKAGRLTLLKDGTLDERTALAEWHATKRPVVQAADPDDVPEDPRPSVPAGSRQVRDPGSPGSQQAGTYAQAKTADALYKARLRQLEYEVKSGALVRAEDAANRWFERARAVRERLLAIPVRLAPEVAAMTDIHEVRRRLDEEIRIAIKELVDEIR